MNLLIKTIFLGIKRKTYEIPVDSLQATDWEETCLKKSDFLDFSIFV